MRALHVHVAEAVDTHAHTAVQNAARADRDDSAVDVVNLDAVARFDAMELHHQAVADVAVVFRPTDVQAMAARMDRIVTLQDGKVVDVRSR